MVDGSSHVSEIFAKQIFDPIKAIRSKKNDLKVSICNHISLHNDTNLDKKSIQEAIAVLIGKTLLKNLSTTDADSCNIIPQDMFSKISLIYNKVRASYCN